jgi:hypothetical protein
VCDVGISHVVGELVTLREGGAIRPMALGFVLGEAGKDDLSDAHDVESLT